MAMQERTTVKTEPIRFVSASLEGSQRERALSCMSFPVCSVCHESMLCQLAAAPCGHVFHTVSVCLYLLINGA
jgi:hypothetical protein